MDNAERVLASGLDRLVPLPGGERADWQDVLRRADFGVERGRRIAFALAGAVAAIVVALGTPVGAAVARGLADFSAWLTGHPGKQAPASDQRAFEAANGRSWASFPKGTELRELVRTTVDGKEYVLSGFRSGNSLCLELRGPGRRDRQYAPACAPASTVAQVSAPIVVVEANGGFWDQYAHQSAQFSYGIVADGVRRVDVEAVDGIHRALLGGNSYLWIEREPSTGNRVKRVSVTDASDRQTTLSVVRRLRFPFASAFAPGKPKGPSRVQATIRNPTIGWLDRHEARGLSPAEVNLTPQQRQMFSTCCSGARLFKPDQLSNIAVGITGRGPAGWCIIIVDGSVGCGPKSRFFSEGPLNFAISSGFANASDQFIAIAGAAADGVTRITIFLADGEHQAAPLKDNIFAAIVPNRFPMRAVAYDSTGHVVGIQSFPTFFPHVSTPSAARVHFHAVLHVTGPHGTKVSVSVGRVVNRQQCWRAEFTTGQSEFDCALTFYTGPKITVDLVQPAGHDLFVMGGVASRVTEHVELHFDDDTLIKTRPIADHYAFAIPKTKLSRERHFAYVLAVDRRGHRVQRQGFGFRMP